MYIQMLHAHLKLVPEDFFNVELSKDNFLVPCLSALLQVGCSGVVVLFSRVLPAGESGVLFCFGLCAIVHADFSTRLQGAFLSIERVSGHDPH